MAGGFYPWLCVSLAEARLSWEPVNWQVMFMLSQCGDWHTHHLPTGATCTVGCCFYLALVLLRLRVGVTVSVFRVWSEFSNAMLFR